MAYICYMLVSEITQSKTYIGITNDMTRRLRQHNGECSGGAKYTHACRPWKIYGYVRGFGEDKSLVLKFEWRWKYLSRKETGNSISKRIKGLEKVLARSEFSNLEFIGI
jgi:structure-specific endonuclease subunit SLX1